MRVAFLSDTFFPQVNGVATTVASFAEELAAQGHKVLILTPAPSERQSKQKWKCEGVEVVHLPSIPAVLYPDFRMSPLLGLPRVMMAIKKFNPDIIHFHTTLAISIDAVLAASVFGKPLVGTNHIYLTPKHDEYLSFISSNPAIRKVITRVVLQYCLSFYAPCQVRIAPSTLLIAELKRTGYPRKIDYLPNPVPPRASGKVSAAQKTLLRRKYGLTGKTIIHVGRLSREKCVDDVLRAFMPLAKADATLKLVIVGDGPDRKRLEKLARSLGVAAQTVFTGFIAHPELMSSGLFAVADVFVTASPMEAQGMVVVEAMAFGLPIVAVAEGAVPEVVGNAGILVPAANIPALTLALHKILSQTKLATKYAAAARKRSHEYSPTYLTKKLLALYIRAIRDTPKRRKLPKITLPW